MIMLLYFLIFFLVGLLIWVMINQSFMPRLKNVFPTKKTSLVSVLVPLRNEQKNVEALVKNLKKLTYPNLEFIFLDDQSSDRTQELLRQQSHQLANSKLINGKSLPKGLGWQSVCLSSAKSTSIRRILAFSRC
ncbi:glycosyltransferase [Alkalicoccobacillus plakortidis]|uniref:glycosyltransferase n=1 Tax=Alkalicoccobacillus plakortidis TaxID=444060 RepID=UPI00358DA3E6